MGLVWAAIGGASIGILAVTGRRRVILAIAFAVVLVGSSVNDLLVEKVFYIRFAIYGVLIGTSLMVLRRQRSIPQVTVPMVAISFLAVASTLWSAQPTITLMRSAGLVLLFGVSIAAHQSWSSEREIERDVAVLVAISTVVFTIGLLGLALNLPWIYEPRVFRYRGVLENPNTVGLLTAFTLPLALGLFIDGYRRLRPLWLIALLVIALSLLLSQSRGGIVATTVGVLGFFMVRSRMTRWKSILSLAAAGMLVGSAFVLFPVLTPAGVEAVIDRFQTERPTEAGGSGRLTAWALAVDVAAERPIAGWGFGTADVVFGPRALAIEEVFHGASPHNAFFNVLIELGPAGVILLVLPVIFLISSMRRLSAIQGARQGPAVFGALAGGLSTQMFESGLTAAGGHVSFMFWYLLAAFSFQLAPRRT